MCIFNIAKVNTCSQLLVYTDYFPAGYESAKYYSIVVLVSLKQDGYLKKK